MITYKDLTLYRTNAEKIDGYTERINDLLNKAGIRALPPSMSGKTSAIQGTPAEKLIIKALELDAERQKLVKANEAVEAWIYYELSEVEYRIITKRYIKGLSWAQISHDIEYSEQHTYKIHSEIVSRLEK